MGGYFALAADGTTLERVAAVGPTEARIYGRFPLGSRLPVADVYADREARYLEHPDDWADYPLSLQLQIETRGWPSVAVLPVPDGERRVGVLYLVFEPNVGLSRQAATLQGLARRWHEQT
jgi:hypothetical protein